jgi:hypothetical protein
LTAAPRLEADTSTDAARRQALLEWALEDADLEEAAGRIAKAKAIREHADAASGERTSPPANLFTPIPKPESNAYLQDALKRAVRFRDSTVRYPKGEAGNVVPSDAEGWRFINICNQALELTSALCHPQSPMASDPRLIAPMLRRFTTVYEYLTPGAKNLADFGISPWLSEMYSLLRSV